MMKGYIYCLTCSTTNNKYYGSTFNIEMRQNKGWYKASCSNFIDPKLIIMEELEVNNKKELLLKETEYIINNDCVNHNVAIMTDETNKNYHKKYREEHTHQIRIQRERYYEKSGVNKPIECPFCFKITSKLKIKRHQTSPFCKKAQEKELKIN